MQYTEDNLIKIDGKGKKGFEIYEEYMTFFKEGFDLSIDEACKFLGCSYRYFTKNLINQIKHIRITTTARKLILQYGKQNIAEPELLNLASKRILFERSDFLTFIKNSTYIEQQYKVLGKELFTDKIATEINKNLDHYNSRANAKNNPKNIKMVFQHIISAIDNKNYPVKYSFSEAEIMPSKLYSLKELKEHFGFRSDEEVYRLIKKFAAKRYLVLDFVRYDINDFNADIELMLTMDYSSFLDLSKKYDVCNRILEQSLKFSRMLAQGKIL